ncbi:MAG: hypothetical protein H0U64_02890 [Gemmatimonadaceae bacterium]|nr:hypothetical protein [Gemmatimonadaceae bacterium]
MKLNRKSFILASTLFAAVVATACFSDSEVTGVTAGTKGNAILSGAVTSSRTLYADTVYTLSGYVKVQSGATLAIHAGTKIVGDTTVAGSSLWILRGAKIDAQGTAANPIVFTSARAAGFRKPGDWGGIIIVGNAKINRTANPIFTEGPTTTAENYAGGTNDNDNSGTMRYVRIEFAGYDVSGGQGQELNSLSLYAVGRGTTLEYIQAVAGLDDSFEWFGGTVDGRYLVSYESGDDHFDWTEGYSGRNQFMLALQTQLIQPRAGTGTLSTDPRGFEGDGCENTKAGCTFANAPFSMPVFANFTVIGPGAGVFAQADGNGSVVRRGSGASMVNGIIGRWPQYGVSLRDAETNSLLAADSVTVRSLILSDNAANFEPAGTNFGQNLNVSATSIQQVTGVAALFSSLATSSLDWTPSATSAARIGGMAAFTGTKVAARVAGFFGGTMLGTSYIGAADPTGTKWWAGWTTYVTN